MILMLICTMFSAVSQILLKQSANEEHASALREYLNWRVIVAYLIFGSVLLLNTYAYTQVDLKYGRCWIPLRTSLSCCFPLAF